MRPIDADALKELFSEVIGHIAQKPEMNGNLEHMIRASAMVIQMIDDAPTVQPDTTTHDSIPVETGKNDGDKTSGDCISRQMAIDVLHGYFDGMLETDTVCPADIYGLFECMPSAQSERKTGQWIQLTCDSAEWWYCSECDKRVQMNPWVKYNYCPNCGVKMEYGVEKK